MRWAGLFVTELLNTLDVCQSNISLPGMLLWQTLHCYYITRNSWFFPPRICCYFLSVFVQEFVFLCVCVFFLNRRISLSLILLLTHWEQFDVGNFISFFSPLVISCHMISTCHLWNTRYVVSKSQMHYIVSIFVWTVTLLMQFLSSSLWNQSIQTLVIKV